MITTLLTYWYVFSLVMAYILVGAWTYGYIYAKPDTDHMDAVMGGIFNPVYWFAKLLLGPIASLGDSFFHSQEEKKVRVEAQAQEHRLILESVDQELRREPPSEAQNKVA